MFEPTSDRPRWAVVLDAFRTHEVGDTVTYMELMDVLGVEERPVAQAAARGAAQRLLLEDQRAVEAVPNVGYRIVEAGEHLRLARSQERRSRRALTRAHSTVIHVDLNGLEEDMKRAVMSTASVYSRVLDAMRQTDRTVARLSRAQDELSQRFESETASNAERLARLEARVEALTVV